MAFLQRFFPGGVGLLRCPVQQYPWGRPGSRSTVGRLAGVTSSVEPCAEFWMGAHPKAPAELVSGNERRALSVAIVDFSAEMLGDRVVKRWGSELPFLFKVLSIGAPLSIQAHPDTVRAKELHARDPKTYPDPFHKPEIGVALTPVEMLAGFMSTSELARTLTNYPELRRIVGPSVVTAEQIYRALFEATDDAHANAAIDLYTRLSAMRDSSSVPERYFRSMFDEYGPADRGLFSFFILNLVTLAPGEGVFIGPNFPHAYLSGELVECMANSDNVVRAGLTRKFQDRETLLSMLDFGAGLPSIFAPRDHLVEPGRIRLSPAPEFFLERCTAEKGRFDFSAVDSLSVLVVLEGEALVRTALGERLLKKGEVGAIPAAGLPWSLELRNGDLFVAAVP